jgi:hypothetical protein
VATKEEIERRREKLIELLSQGYTEREAARLLDVSEPTVWIDMRALRTDPKWFSERISNLFDRLLNELDLKNPQDRRCAFTNISRLLARTMPLNTNIQLKGDIMLKGEWWKLNDGRAKDVSVSTPPEATSVS